MLDPTVPLTATGLGVRGDSMARAFKVWQLSAVSQCAMAQQQEEFDYREYPEGVICLWQGEMQVCWSLMRTRVLRHYVHGEYPLPQWTTGSSCAQGRRELRNAVARQMTKRLYSLTKEQVVFDLPPFRVQASELFMTAGSSVALNLVLNAICDSDDAVLVPSPFTSTTSLQGAGFGSAIDCFRVGIPLDDDDVKENLLSADALEYAFGAAERESPGHKKPKVLLLTNPLMPLGRVLLRQELEEILGWCAKKANEGTFHVVCDETFALSTYANSDIVKDKIPQKKFKNRSFPKFTSVASVLDGDLGQNVHVLWGVSEDLGMSGFRVAALWSKNAHLHRAMAAASLPTSLPTPIQDFTTQLLEDDGFLDAYVKTQATHLIGAASIVAAELDSLGIDYKFPQAGGAILCDLSPLLLEVCHHLQQQKKKKKGNKTENNNDDEDPPSLELMWEAEYVLTDMLIERGRIALTPGSTLSALEPGWFRFCFAAVPPHALAIALQRFVDFSRDLLQLPHQPYW